MDPEERARLLAIAYGADSDPAAADRARRALSGAPASGTAAEPRPTGEAAPAPVPALEPGRDPEPAPEPQASLDRARRRRRPSLRIAALVAGTAVVAAALGAGGSMLAARLGPTVVATDGSSAGAGTGVRVAATLAAARTGEDRLPSTMTADVDRSTTHVIFETYPGQPPIRWRVWVATASGGAEICFVVSSDGYASDVTCTARAEALDGVVHFVTRDGGEGLSVLDDHGTVGIDLVGVG